MSTDNVFVFDSSNQDYLLGKRSKPDVGSRGSCLMGIVLLLIVMAIAGIATTITLWDDYQTLRNTGVEVTASYTDKREESDGDGGANHYLLYTFIINERTYQNETKVNRATYESTEIGTPVTIVYDPDDPQLSQLAELNVPPQRVIIASGLFSIFAVIAVTFAVYRNQQSRQLHQKGQLVTGKIDAVKHDTAGDNDPIMIIECSFVTPDTNRRLSAKKTLSPEYHDEPPIGTPIAVYYATESNFRLL